MIGKINSIETMGLVDGPGIRFVVFMQGCNLRCLFCHNPETWSINNGIDISVSELMEKIKKYKNYFNDDGGVTFSGGEPLLQSGFLLNMLKECKRNNINTCIDTSGVGSNLYGEILKYTDLVIFDIKDYRELEYKKLTGKSIKESIKFLNKCRQLNKKIWLRQVIIPGINDNKEYIIGLKEFIKDIKNVSKIELLPYRTLGITKYMELNIPYILKDVPDMDLNKLETLQEIIKK